MCSHIHIVHVVIFSNSFTNTITYKIFWSLYGLSYLTIQSILSFASLTDVAAKSSKQY